MNIHSFLDPASETFSHILIDDTHRCCAIFDPVLDFDASSGHTSHTQADKLINFIQTHQLTLHYIIETHAHADHLSSAPYIKSILGGQTVIGKAIDVVQAAFKDVYNLDTSFKTDGRQFDILTQEGQILTLGDITLTAISVAGHTPADMAYIATCGGETAIFVGDTLFAPDVGTARCDFPKGSAKDLYRSIQRLLNFSDDTRLYLCHDYPPHGRDYQPFCTVGDTRQANIHVKDGVSEAEFIAMRESRDKTLSMPRLILPAVQVNINAGELPTAEDNGVRYLKLPINAF
ncbi:MAG: MBL fold metallo-hydrolase [Moraxella sp.]|nr:MBL fold metallo-hydrolase [Moraxella sp.]